MPAGQRTSQGARGTRRGTDARRSPAKQSDNRKKLGVGPDHRTASMRRGRRGTAP
jgi:hypothetical protein